MRSAAWRCGAFGVPLIAAALTNPRAETIALPTFDVVATTPLGGGRIDVSKVPDAVWQRRAQRFDPMGDYQCGITRLSRIYCLRLLLADRLWGAAADRSIAQLLRPPRRF